LAEPEFKAEHAAARHAIFEGSINRIQALAANAVDTLDALLDVADAPSVRLGAARTIAEIGIHQHDADTIMRKLDEIEQWQQRQRNEPEPLAVPKAPAAVLRRNQSAMMRALSEVRRRVDRLAAQWVGTTGCIACRDASPQRLVWDSVPMDEPTSVACNACGRQVPIHFTVHIVRTAATRVRGVLTVLITHRSWAARSNDRGPPVSTCTADGPRPPHTPAAWSERLYRE
jgi:hypothetical protein